MTEFLLFPFCYVPRYFKSLFSYMYLTRLSLVHFLQLSISVTRVK